MPKAPKFTLRVAPEALEHLKAIDPKFRGLIRELAEEQLSYQPDQATRNRKLLRPPAPFGAAWELRLGPDNRFRVFYRINREERIVRVLAIGIKVRNRLFIGGKEFEA
ncbi:MAG: type II toxin-antitoxin system RelE/ParE family toxin [Planctomycetes bacterium]|nr:type II toxin-antitoxin system RelE/ParE family toxin [Planctomycetota bacterium]